MSIEEKAKAYVLAREALTAAKAARAAVMGETDERLDCVGTPSEYDGHRPEGTCYQMAVEEDKFCPACVERREASKVVSLAAKKQGGALRALRHAVLDGGGE